MVHCDITNPDPKLRYTKIDGDSLSIEIEMADLLFTYFIAQSTFKPGKSLLEILTDFHSKIETCEDEEIFHKFIEDFSTSLTMCFMDIQSTMIKLAANPEYVREKAKETPVAFTGNFKEFLDSLKSDS